ncbi:hypothetical protein ET989_14505 [Propioniciclava sinopodophylli]|uniref:Uncharacterized protein n=1 Tax=Propioniciclava sinopodophylli TaxID=1837344 RepID=A0A4Q9KAK3_9ACTN|nr:HEPN domain-containing protein [Propioniciclava sinopodophylli]TBT82474.1 hypothetical protein ET989_14505 [Propioniciclava sinopodophylli]
MAPTVTRHALVQSGIALENLGYQIVVQKKGGTGLNTRRQLTYRDALEKILDDMTVKPFEDTDEWIQDSIDCYMGAKHADRATPDTLTQVDTLRRNLLVLRFWIGLEIGVKPESLTATLGRDPLLRSSAWRIERSPESSWLATTPFLPCGDVHGAPRGYGATRPPLEP